MAFTAAAMRRLRCVGDLGARSRDTTSESLQPIQSARAQHDLRAVFSQHLRSRLAYSTARSRMLSELAPVMTTTLSLIPRMKFYLLWPLKNCFKAYT